MTNYPPARSRDLRGLSWAALVLAFLFVVAALIGVPSLALLGLVVTLPLSVGALVADQRGRAVAAAAFAMALVQLLLALVLH